MLSQLRKDPRMHRRVLLREVRSFNSPGVAAAKVVEVSFDTVILDAKMCGVSSAIQPGIFATEHFRRFDRLLEASLICYLSSR